MEDVAGEAAVALQRLRGEASAVIVDEVLDETGLKACAPVLRDAELLIDAVVGTGFKPPLRGLAVLLREMVEGLDTPMVAVDLPSGWDANSMEQTADGSFRADAVVTFTAPKMAHMFGHLTRNEKTGGTFGPVVVAGIGSPEQAVVSAGGLTWTGTSKVLAEKARDVNTNKDRFGPELMMVPLAEGTKGAVSFKNLDGAKLDALVKQISVVAVGPGLSTEGDAPAFARQVVEKTTVPIVIDADALNAFAGKAHLLNGRGRVLVLTPHPGEMARLAGLTVKEVEADRVGLARRFATEHRLTLVLKGWRTLVAHPDGSIAVNTSGNPAMAKGGSGDILTGIVAGMLAQFPGDVARAVETAVYLHGLAADFAVHAMEEHTVLATDTVTHLSDAFRYRVTDEDGLTWICGLRG
jgi:NAD(P)H-hydrate epimerase